MVIADHQRLFRQGIVSQLAKEKTITIVAEASTEGELLRILENNDVDVLLLDLSIPLLYGNHSFQALKQRYPSIHVIILSSFLEKNHIKHYMSNGASACLDKSCGGDALIEAIKLTMRPAHFDNRSLVAFRKKSSKQTDDSEKKNLTEREAEVLYHICQGKTNKEIADTLHITRRTVDFHRGNLYEKTQTVTSAALAVYAIRNGLLVI